MNGPFLLRQRATWPAADRRLGVLLLVFMAGCELPGQPNPADRPLPADRVVNFEALYRRHCSGCHGADGRVGPAPPLNDPIFLAIVPDAELVRVIAEGRSGTPMPAFSRERGGPLTDTQMTALINGIKPRWGQTARALAPVPPYAVELLNPALRTGPGGRGSVRAAPAEEARTEPRPPRMVPLATLDSIGGDESANLGDIQRGSNVFDRACAACHGPDGEGGTDGDRSVGAINDPAFLALISDQALRRYAITGRSDLGMPGYSEKAGRSDDFQPLTAREITDLVAFLASWRQEDRPASVDPSRQGPTTSRPDDPGRQAAAGGTKGE